MKDVLKMLFKMILTVFMIILLLVLFHVSFNFFQRKIVGNMDYYLITSKYTSIYSLVTSLLISFFIFLLLFKEQSKSYLPYFFNLKVIPILIIFMTLGYFGTLFQMDVFYEDHFTSYDLIHMKGVKHELKEIKNVNIFIKKHINQTYDLYYEVVLENEKIELFSHATDFGLELKKYDHLSFFHEKVKENDILIKKDDQYLSDYLEHFTQEEQKKINQLFR